MKGKKAVVLAEKTLQKHLGKHPPCSPGCSEKGKGNLAEKAMQNHLVKHPPRPYKDLAAREWFVEPGRSDKGKGDLVFSHGKKAYLVVETKNLPTATGPTARTSRNQRRHVVRDQAQTYGKAWQRKHPSAKVETATYTNLNGLQKLGAVKDQQGNREDQTHTQTN
jgi:hypothetical protein